jgi:non-ribosomal peptide synthetase component E (peptide arylation enzyme)
MAMSTMSSPKRPDRVIFAESLPVGATGKVQKNTLRELYATASRRCS